MIKIPCFLIELLKKKIESDIKKREAKYPIDDAYKPRINIHYAGDNDINHTFDIYYAKDKAKNVTIIDIHGGSYILGNKRDNYQLGTIFLDNGFNFITLEYAPNDGTKDTKDIIDQCAMAINYIFSHEKELGIKNTKYVMMGDSAGGHFAIILTLAMNNGGYAKQLGYSFTRRAELLVLNCSVYDFENLGKGMITKKAQKRLFGPNYQDKEARKLISPKQHIALLDIPLFTSSCTKDFIRSETTSLISDLEKLNKPHTFIDIKEKDVGHVHNVWNPYSKLSMYVNEEMVKFINKFLS